MGYQDVLSYSAVVQINIEAVLVSNASPEQRVTPYLNKVGIFRQNAMLQAFS